MKEEIRKILTEDAELYLAEAHAKQLVGDILLDLKMQGVVIKVDRELPRDCQDCGQHHCHYDSDGIQDCSCGLSVSAQTQTHGLPDTCPLKSNLVAVEELI